MNSTDVNTQNAPTHGTSALKTQTLSLELRDRNLLPPCNKPLDMEDVKRLCTVQIQAAIRDLRTTQEYSSGTLKVTSRIVEAFDSSAIWLFATGDGTGPHDIMSFSWCCGMLEIRPEKSRSALLEKLPPRSIERLKELKDFLYSPELYEFLEEKG